MLGEPQMSPIGKNAITQELHHNACEGPIGGIDGNV
tara:strand:+ start:2321 stop:2428 length:108 start_codon:yes stop_codon:yes gene_type:complete